jgi:hypothetical protein
MATKVDGNLHVTGTLTAGDFTPPASSITNAAIEAGAGIAASKVQHQHQPVYSTSGTVATSTVVLYVVRGATCTVEEVYTGSVAKAVGDSTVTVDVKKNGTTILSGVVTLDSGNSNYVPEDGTVSVTSGVVDDVYTAVITATVGTGTLPTGFYVGMQVREDAD